MHERRGSKIQSGAHSHGASQSYRLTPADGSVRLGVEWIAPTFDSGRSDFDFQTSLTGGYDDNVNTTPTGSPSWFASPSAVFTYQSW